MERSCAAATDSKGHVFSICLYTCVVSRGFKRRILLLQTCHCSSGILARSKLKPASFDWQSKRQHFQFSRVSIAATMKEDTSHASSGEPGRSKTRKEHTRDPKDT